MTTENKKWNQSESLDKIQGMMKEVNYFIAESKTVNGYKCFSGYVTAHLETLRDEINSSFEELRKEIGLIHR